MEYLSLDFTNVFGRMICLTAVLPDSRWHEIIPSILISQNTFMFQIRSKEYGSNVQNNFSIFKCGKLCLVLTFWSHWEMPSLCPFVPKGDAILASHVTDSNKSYNSVQNRVRRPVLTGFFICISLSSAIIVPDWQRYVIVSRVEPPGVKYNTCSVLSTFTLSTIVWSPESCWQMNEANFSQVKLTVLFLPMWWMN